MSHVMQEYAASDCMVVLQDGHSSEQNMYLRTPLALTQQCVLCCATPLPPYNLLPCFRDGKGSLAQQQHAFLIACGCRPALAFEFHSNYVEAKNTPAEGRLEKKYNNESFLKERRSVRWTQK